MKKPRGVKSKSILVWVLGLFGVGALSTAYIDPGAGGILIQVLVATILGAGLLIRAYWSRIKAFFGRKPKDIDDPADSEDAR